MAFQARYATLNEIFKDAVQKFPNRELFGQKKDGTWSWTTYATFGDHVEKMRGGLASLGVGKGDVVAVIANNRPEWAEAAYACYGLGAAYVPMYEAQLPKDWEYIVKDCEAKVLIVANEAILEQTLPFLESIGPLQNIVLLDGHTKDAKGVVSYASLLEMNKTAPVADVGKDDIAGLIYTSGTTGNPKGVILSHFNLASNVSAVHEVFPMEEADRSLSFLPWAHSFGQTVELHALFSMGASMAIAESVDKIIANLAEVQPTLLFSVPRIFNKLYAAVQKTISSKPGIIQNLVKKALKCTAKERAGEKLSFGEHIALTLADKLVFSKVRARFGGRLKYAFSGGSAISKEVAEFIDSLGVVVYEGYGLTETSPIATANWPGSRHIGSVGRAIPGVRIEIDSAAVGDKAAREDGRVEGEIVVHGPNVMKGYHKKPDENAAVFTKDGGFRTGDLGCLDGQGFLYITGRIKEQYKLENGKYVVPTPLEEELKLSPLIANVMVYGDNRPFNVALIVVQRDSAEERLRAAGTSVPAGDAFFEDAGVRALYTEEVAAFGKKFKGFEGIRDFCLIGDDFTTDNGMLTPSLKLKRRKVIEVYGAKIDALYAKKPQKTEGRGATAAS
ncbi:MAG: long-chain fatty acid--CoA ligase [Polyangiaceae bacterium]